MATDMSRTQTGFSIVEVMVAITISLVLILGVSNVYLGSKESYKLNSESSRVQENGRFAMEFISVDLRQTGYLGCANGSFMKFTSMIDPTKYSGVTPNVVDWNGSNSVQGYDNVTSGTIDSTLTNMGMVVGTADGNIVSGTDVLLLRGGSSCEGGEVDFTGKGSTFRYKTTANIKIKDAVSCGIEKYSPVMVTDCASVDVFCVSNNPQSGADLSTLAHASGCNTASKLEGTYGPGSEVLTLRTTVFYIGYNSRGGKSLFRLYLDTDSGGAASDIGMQREELVEGVIDMQLRYGDDTNGDGVANFYDTAGNVTMDDVNAIRLNILVESLNDNVTQTPQAYTFNGTAVTPTDNKLRRVFSSTIALRNRMK